jgi:hypothetical protein
MWTCPWGRPGRRLRPGPHQSPATRSALGRTRWPGSSCLSSSAPPGALPAGAPASAQQHAAGCGQARLHAPPAEARPQACGGGVCMLLRVVPYRRDAAAAGRQGAGQAAAAGFAGDGWVLVVLLLLGGSGALGLLAGPGGAMRCRRSQAARAQRSACTSRPPAHSLQSCQTRAYPSRQPPGREAGS